MLRDLHWAEAKGTGIRTMRRLASDAGLPLPEFHSDRQANEFRITLFLHNLLTEDDHAWLRSLGSLAVSADEAKVLVYARATGAVDNTACRDFCGLDTLAASLVLRRLRDRGLLGKQGLGNRTYYTLPGVERLAPNSGQSELPLNDPSGTLKQEDRPSELATLLGKDRHYLRNKYLIPMVSESLLRFRYPESAKHPNQAYVTVINPERTG